MRKFTILIALLVFMQLIAEGQQLGLKGGLDILGASYKYNGISENSNPQMGFHFGMVLDFKLSGSLTLETGVVFTEKGFQEDYQLPDKDKTTFFYFDIPALLVCKVPSGDHNLYFQAGPYLGLGLFTNLTGSSFVMKKGFGEEPQQYRHTDLGIGLGSGLEFNVLRFGLYYSMGLIDIRNAVDTRIRNMVLGLEVAYMFGHR